MMKYTRCPVCRGRKTKLVCKRCAGTGMVRTEENYYSVNEDRIEQFAKHQKQPKSNKDTK